MRFLLPLLIALLGSAQAQTTAQTTAQGHEPSWQAQLGRAPLRLPGRRWHALRA
jgi:hypothetical protein